MISVPQQQITINTLDPSLCPETKLLILELLNSSPPYKPNTMDEAWAASESAGERQASLLQVDLT